MRSEQELVERRRRVLRGMRQYYDIPFHPVRGEGYWLYDRDGRQFLDAYNNVPHVGHCHPQVVEALCRQAGMLNINTRYLFESAVVYAERLVSSMPSGLNACMFTCTGSEANDLASRLAKNFTGAEGIITSENAYHGNTTFLDSIDGSSIKQNRTSADYWVTIPAPPDANRYAAGQRDWQEDAKQYHQQLRRAISLLKARGVKPAALLIESFFCTDGVRVPPSGFMDEAIGYLRSEGALLIVDEVQAGLARCGSHMWAFQRLGIRPDVVVLGKPMGNGHPIGVAIARSDVVDSFYSFDRYFNTFAGNPVSCAVGLAVLDVIERENLQERASRIGGGLKAALVRLSEKHSIIGDVRGEGLLLGIELVLDRETGRPASTEARWVINEMCRRGVLVGLTGPNRNSRNVLKVRPPLVFDESAADLFISTLDQSLTVLKVADRSLQGGS